ncbi:hypothetical protein [Bacillus sp. FJAT-47783]|uniref:hypothetical protein n=1 Tax=Bacillus sp. FJAT-47783 TaxID=2922712 RepID=UPI001FACF1B3|nr:hypothetical protein [Bacillus sp. FJAT-47783]
MLNNLMKIEHELQLMKKELQTCLMEQHNLPLSIRAMMNDELMDVERALWKLQNGQFGICEKTSQLIPFDKLHLLPTARTVDDFSLQRFFEKREVYS